MAARPPRAGVSMAKKTQMFSRLASGTTRILIPVCLFAVLSAAAAFVAFQNGSFMNGPAQTEYAKRFLELCEGQQWFIDETEEQPRLFKSLIFAITV